MRLRDDDIDRLAAAVTRRTTPDEPEGWLEQATHRRLLVHTVTGSSIEGTLRLAAEDGVVLWNARLMSGKPVTLDGEVFIPRSQVLFVQTVRM